MNKYNTLKMIIKCSEDHLTAGKELLAISREIIKVNDKMHKLLNNEIKALFKGNSNFIRILIELDSKLIKNVNKRLIELSTSHLKKCKDYEIIYNNNKD